LEEKRGDPQGLTKDRPRFVELGFECVFELYIFCYFLTLWSVGSATATTAVSCKTYLVLDLLHWQLEKKTVLKKPDKLKQQKVVFLGLLKNFKIFLR
jgi:hypothetical protein